MIPVLWVPQRSRGSWDMGLIEELTAGPEFEHNPPGPLNSKTGAIVVLAGQHCLDAAAALCEAIGRYAWALTVVCSDEESLFPVHLLPHDAKHVVWGQYHSRPEFDRVIPIGLPPGTTETLAPFLGQPRSLSVAFAGQATHERRVELVDTIKLMATDVQRFGDIGWAATTGFREGLSQDRYLDMLARTRIAPCPSGPHSLDSFRLYEALEAGALPVVEHCTPHGNEGQFWWDLFGHYHPIPTLPSWDLLPTLVDQYADPNVWEAKRDEVADWWDSYRTRLTGEFFATVGRLSES